MPKRKAPPVAESSSGRYLDLLARHLLDDEESLSSTELGEMRRLEPIWEASRPAQPSLAGWDPESELEFED